MPSDTVSRREAVSWVKTLEARRTHGGQLLEEPPFTAVTMICWWTQIAGLE